MVATRKSSPKEDPDEEVNIEDMEIDVKKGPPQSQPAYERKFVIAKKGSIGASQIFMLRHPRCDEGVLYRLSKNTCDEVISCGDQLRSWFYGNSVVSDGMMKIFIPIHPLFLALPYLYKKKSLFEVLDEIFIEEEYPAISKLTQNEQLQKGLKIVADVKEIDDTVLFRYNEEKAMTWLEKKFNQLQMALKEGAGLHPEIVENKEVLDRYTFAVLCDTVLNDLVETLKFRLAIKDAPIQEIMDQSYNKRKVDDDEDLYSSEKPAVKKARESAVQKQLKVASKGTKSISSFFGKKL